MYRIFDIVFECYGFVVHVLMLLFMLAVIGGFSAALVWGLWKLLILGLNYLHG